jgi:hypothetical protein
MISMNELTARQAITLIEARELLRAQGIEADELSDAEVLSHAFRLARDVVDNLQQLRATLGAIAQMQQAIDGEGETPN